MPITIVSPSIAVSNVKMQWRQQYTTAGTNQKLAGIIPAGIYRGLNLTTNGAALTVSVVADSVKQDHLAVYETADGYSLTFRDAANTEYDLDLSDPSLLSNTLVVCIYMDYQPSKDTTATFIIYTVTEFNALGAGLRGELIVLGTVVNPASGVISASSITSDRRTIASFNQSLLQWRPLLSNPGFERAPDNHVITGLEVESWTATDHWKSSSSDVDAGTRCVEFNIAGSGTFSETFRQYVGAGTVAGSRVVVKLSKKVVGAATGGSGKIVVGFTGADGGTATELSKTFTINATDASYVDIVNYFTVPAGQYVVKYIGVAMVAAIYGSSGTKLRLDNMYAYLEPESINNQLNFHDERSRMPSVSALTLEDITSTTYSDLAATLFFKKSLPSASEGQVELGRKDLTSTGLAPAFSLPGRIVNLGKNAIDSEANALLPRVSLPVSIASSTDYTMLMEATPSGGSPVRLYLGTAGRMVLATNFYWDNTQWVKDISGNSSSLFRLNPDELWGMAQPASDTSVAAECDPTLASMPSYTLFRKRKYDLAFSTWDAINVVGRFQRYGFHYRDDFIGPIGGSYGQTASGAGVTTKSVVRPNTMIVTSDTSNASSVYGLFDLAGFNKFNVIKWSGRVMFTDNINGDRRFGLFQPSTDFVHIGFYQSSSSSNMFAIGASHNSGTGTTVGSGTDTGFAPALNTWYYYMVNSSASSSGPSTAVTSWWISTTEDFNLGTVVSGFHSHTWVSGVSGNGLTPGAFSKTVSGAAPTLEMDYYEAWSNVNS